MPIKSFLHSFALFSFVHNNATRYAVDIKKLWDKTRTLDVSLQQTVSVISLDKH